MSTRAVILVKDKYGYFCVYKHCDGYPQGDFGVLSELKHVFQYAWPLPCFEAADFSAAIIAAWKKKGGGNIYLTDNVSSHGDLAYFYKIIFKDYILNIEVYKYEYIKSKRRAINIFSGTYEQAVDYFC